MTMTLAFVVYDVENRDRAGKEDDGQANDTPSHVIHRGSRKYITSKTMPAAKPMAIPI
jgi:hypothetical protein